MNTEQIRCVREKLKHFQKGDEKIFTFNVECELPKRIKTIYSIIFPGSKKILFYLRFMIARVAQFIDYSPVKVILYKIIGMKIGRGVFIASDVILDPHFPKMIEIKDYAILGWGVKIFTHEYAEQKYRIGKIVIGEGVLVGAFSTIRGGVTIGNNSEVPYDSIIINDIEQDTAVKSILRKQIGNMGSNVNI